MGALTDYSQAVPTQPGGPGFNETMGGLNGLIGNLSGDIMEDYTKARQASQVRAPALQQLADEASSAPMQGYDENAYNAQAWSQAGIGAATPTISALESLNRAVAGYSGVKLQQRADFSKRLQQEKQMKLEFAQAQEAGDKATAKDSAAQLIQMWKDGLMSKQQLMSHLYDEFVNVPGRGLVSKKVLQQGGTPEQAVVVPSIQPSQMFQTMLTSIAAEAEQDKNLHFKTPAERDAWIKRTAEQRWKVIAAASNGAIPDDPYSYGVTTIPAKGAPPPVVGAPATGEGLTPENFEFLQGKAGYGAPQGDRGAVMGAPGTTATDIAEGTSDLQVSPVPKERARQGEAPPIPVAVESPPEDTAIAPAAPWGKFATMPLPKPSIGQRSGMFSKEAQQRAIAQDAASEKNAEDAYARAAQEAEGTASWYDTLRQMESTDLKATGSFATVRQATGNLLASLGYPNSEVANNAKSLSMLNNLLMQGIQSRLSTQNGVQARDDAIREQQSFAQLSDPPTVFRALIKQAQAKALRVVEKEQFYQAWKAQHGTYNGATTGWSAYIKETPIMTMIGGVPIYYNQFIDGFVARNKAQFDKEGVPENKRVEIATEAWRKQSKGRK